MRALFTGFSWFFAVAFFILLAFLAYNGSFSGRKPTTIPIAELPSKSSGIASKIDTILPPAPPKIEAEAEAKAPLSSGTAAISGTYGDWQMSCETAVTIKSDKCVLVQSVMAKDRPNVGLVVIAGRYGEQKIEILRVITPLGVALQMGLGVRIDDQVIGAMEYTKCTPDACIAEARLANNDLLKKLKNGKNLSFVVFLSHEEGIGIPVSLNGFAQGYEQLK